MLYTTQNNITEQTGPVTSLDPAPDMLSCCQLLVRSSVLYITRLYEILTKKERRRSRSSFRTSDVGSQTLDRPLLLAALFRGQIRYGHRRRRRLVR